VTRVALLLNNPYTTDSRSWKIATSLVAAGYEVTVVARAAPGLPAAEVRDGVSVVRIEPPRTLAWLPAPRLPSAGGRTAASRGLRDRIRDTVGRAVQGARYLARSRALADSVSQALASASGPGGASASRVDVWQSEGLVMLPVALRLRRRHGGRAVYDARDIATESGRFVRLPRSWRRLLARQERGWARSADAVLTVNRPYAAHLSAAFGRDLVIVPNGPLPFEPPDPAEHRFHERLGLEPGTRVALMVGAVVSHRGIEVACRAIGEVPDAVLVVVGDGEARGRLAEAAAALPHADRVVFFDPLPPDELVAWTAAADVAVMPIEGSTLNHRLTTPTRLYDAMGAGVPVVASDLPGMAEIVRETGIGVLVDPSSSAAVAAGIREILDATPERRAAWREACLAAARGPYAWGRGMDRLLQVYATFEEGADPTSDPGSAGTGYDRPR
jgi:glycosyltransferase involved in cell wall biosynthesis